MGNILSPEAGPLFDAIAEGNVDAAVKALEAHPRLSQTRSGKKCRTLYHACASHGQVAVLKRLCEHVWQTLPDELGKIHAESIPEGRFHPTIYRAMNSYDETGLTPLMLACRKGHVDTVMYLLSQGADPWLGDRLLARSALHHAARANQPECVEAILNSPYVELKGKVRSKECKLVDYPNSSGYTPLHYTAASRAADAAAALFRHGANPNAKTFDMGFDFIQLDRGSTPLHAAARFQNLELAMVLLKHWDENLRHLDVTDPRVVDNHERVKPYQVPGVKMNKALARVLDPDTPIKDISDPFGETSRPHSPPTSKIVPVRGAAAPSVQRQESDMSSRSSGPVSSDKAPAGGAGPNTAKATFGLNVKASAGEHFTVYQCAEFEVDGGSTPHVPAVPPQAADAAVMRASTGLRLPRSQSDNRRVVLGQSSSSDAGAANGLNRTRSGAAIPALSDKFNSYCSTSSDDVNGRLLPGRHASPAAAAPAAVATAAGSKSATVPMSAFMTGTSSVTSEAGRGPVSEGQLPSPGSRRQPLTPPCGDLAAVGGLTKEVAGGAHSGLARTTSDGPPRAAGLSSQASGKFTAGGRLFTRSSSQKLSGDIHTTSTTAAAAAAAVPALKPGLSQTQSSSRRGSSPTGNMRDAEAPPPVFSAWGDNKNTTTATTPSVIDRSSVSDRRAAVKDKLTVDVPDFSRDSHSESSQPVAITMYPHRMVSVQQLKAGDTEDAGDACNSVKPEGGTAGAKRRMVHHERTAPHTTHHHHQQQRHCKGGPDYGSQMANQSAGTLNLSRRGLMPTAELSEDESRLEDLGAAVKALSPAASRRSRMVT